MLALSCLQERRELVSVDELRRHHRRRDKNDGYPGGTQGLLDLLTPRLARFNLGVIPTVCETLPFEKREVRSEPLAPPFVLVAVADEDLGRHDWLARLLARPEKLRSSGMLSIDLWALYSTFTNAPKKATR